MAQAAGERDCFDARLAGSISNASGQSVWAYSLFDPDDSAGPLLCNSSGWGQPVGVKGWGLEGGEGGVW